MLEKIKDPGSAITHFIGMLMAMFAATPLIIKSLHEPDYIHVISLTVFIVSMILLYAASTIYHTLNLSEKTNRILRKLDHSMIFVLIAGSYTPICLIVLKGPVGYFLFALVWAIALIGIIVKICWITCPKWFSSVLYISDSKPGSAYWLSHRLSIRSLRQLLDGSWQAVSFTLSAASFML